MNTREREVMDALAKELRDAIAADEECEFEIPKSWRAALAAYDALLAEGSASSEGAATEPAVLNRNLPCDPPTRRYTVEPHGGGMAIYNGRDKMHHGFNLGHLTEYDPALPKLIEAALNAYTAPKASSEWAEAVGFVGSPAHVAVWDAIAELVEASGGRNVASVARMSAVPKVERAIAAIRHPQPAQGDCRCYAETSYANGIDETTTHRCAKHAQGEHEQRSCAGSERRQDWERQSMEFLAKKLRSRGDDLSNDSASWLEKFAANESERRPIADEVVLPELPTAAVYDPGRFGFIFSAEQMHAYARAAIAAQQRQGGAK